MEKMNFIKKFSYSMKAENQTQEEFDDGIGGFSGTGFDIDYEGIISYEKNNKKIEKFSFRLAHKLTRKLMSKVTDSSVSYKATFILVCRSFSKKNK